MKKVDPLVKMLWRLDSPLLAQVLDLEHQYAQQPQRELLPEDQAVFDQLVTEVLRE